MLKLNLGNFGPPVRLDQVGLKPATQWQTPPALLRLEVDGQCIYGVLETPDSEEEFEFRWSLNLTSSAPDLDALHADLETFREQHSAYLNDIEPDDLDRRLDAFQGVEDWAEAPDESDASHRAAWDRVAQSDELRSLAARGYRLYREAFAHDPELDQFIRGLAPGTRISIDWREGSAGWVPNIPWPLMYCEPEPLPDDSVDPWNFLGLRFRLEHIAYTPPIGSKALGNPDSTNCGYVYYWNGPVTDQTLIEARWQHERWRTRPKYRAVPGFPVPTGDPRDLTLKFLGHPGPHPMGLVYLFCQSEFAGNQASLCFGTPINGEMRDNYVILEPKIRPEPLADNPLVFINACRSSGGSGAMVSNQLEKSFFRRKCRAYLGTVNRVPIEMASRFAEVFFHFLFPQPGEPPMAAGEAVAQARLFFWTQYRNIGGLYYNYVNRYDCYMADAGGLAKLR